MDIDGPLSPSGAQSFTGLPNLSSRMESANESKQQSHTNLNPSPSISQILAAAIENKRGMVQTNPNLTQTHDQGKIQLRSQYQQQYQHSNSTIKQSENNNSNGVGIKSSNMNQNGDHHESNKTNKRISNQSKH
jgi:hypothetical protein